MKSTKFFTTVFTFVLLLASLLTMTASIVPSVEAYGAQPYDRTVSGCYNCYQGAFAYANPLHYTYANNVYRPMMYQPPYVVGSYYGHYYGKNTLRYSHANPYNAVYSNRYYAARAPTYIYSNSYESLRNPYYRYW